MALNKNSFIHNLKQVFVLISVFNLIVFFQNCEQSTFKSRLPDIREHSAESSNNASNIPFANENFDDGEDIDNIFEIPQENESNSEMVNSATASLVNATTSTGRSYYMSPTGNDANPGTLAKPWRTLDRLQSAQSILRPGDFVYFRGGNYMISDSSKVNTFSWSARGTSSARITYKNYLNEKPVIVYDRRNILTAHKIAVFPGQYTTIDGLSFRQTEESRRMALDVNNGLLYSNRDNYFSKNVRGIYITTSNVILRNCVIDNFSSVGLAVKGSNALVENCIFKNAANHIWYLQGPYSIFRYNSLDGSRQLTGGGVYGIQIQYVNTHHNKIYGNFIKNAVAGGVMYSGKVSYNEVYNNIFINVGGGRSSGNVVSTWTEDGAVGVGNKFYNNTALGKTASAVFGGKIAQFPVIDIRDNIFHLSVAKPIGYSGTNLRNNIFYNVTGTIPTGNKKVNPLLVNPAGTTAVSAMLKAGSPAIDGGKSTLFPSLDFNKRKRPVGKSYDIGAFEY